MPASPARLSRLCRYIQNGFCLHGFITGLHQAEHTCQPMRHLVAAYDSFLTRAEALNLTEDSLGSLWAHLQQEMVEQNEKLGHLGQHHTCVQKPTECPHYAKNVCLLTVPQCKKPCQNFSPLFP